MEVLRTGVKQGTGQLSSNGNATLYECKQTTERTHAPLRLSIWIAAERACSVAIRFWNGTTYTTAKVSDSAATTTAKGGTTSRLNIIQLDMIVPPFCEVVLSETSGGGTSDYEYSIFGVME